MNQPEKPELSSFIIDGPPWEKKHEIGFFVAFMETLKAFLFHPAHTFSVMRRNAGLGDALIYTVAIQVFTFLWMFALNEPNPELLFEQFPELEGMLELPANFSQIMVLIYPVSVILFQFIASLSVHLTLTWRKLQRYDFSLLFRIIAYAGGTASLLTILPILGGFLAMIMTVYLIYVGLRTIYALDAASFALTLLVAIPVMIGLYIAVVFGTSIFLIILSVIL